MFASWVLTLEIGLCPVLFFQHLCAIFYLYECKFEGFKKAEEMLLILSMMTLIANLTDPVLWLFMPKAPALIFVPESQDNNSHIHHKCCRGKRKHLSF